jgi:hypothetical protein
VRVQDLGALSHEWRSCESVIVVHLRRIGGSNRGVDEVLRAEAHVHTRKNHKVGPWNRQAGTHCSLKRFNTPLTFHVSRVRKIR